MPISSPLPSIPKPTPEPFTIPSTARPLGRMQLVLRLAAGQAVELVARLYGIATHVVERRARLAGVRRLADSLAMMAILPAGSRIARLASRAARYLTDSIQFGRRGAE